MGRLVHKASEIYLLVFLFFAITIWWLLLYFSGLRENFHNYLFAASYGIIALYGGVYGLIVARNWGGWKSVMGRAILLLSLGLLAAEFGQLVFSYYNIFLHIEIPYPSIADLGFFSNIPLYSFGMLYLAKASGVQINFRKVSHTIQIVLLPVALLSISYIAFLKDYQFDIENPLKTFLDFGYPLGQALYVSIALFAYSFSKNILGGVMRKRIILIIVAFVFQYLADYNFLFQSSRGTWYNGGYGDYLYFFAYFLMALSIIELKTVLTSMRVKANS
jgi:hypothetical protein